jgi:uncharacterized protein
MMRTQLVIIQPTPFCNINCRYCYLPYRSVTKHINTKTLSRIFELLFSSSFVSNDITVVWHAGEPLVLPISFYEQAFQYISYWNKKSIRVKNSFQTNATLITQEWCDFFKQRNIQVGLSLDGPEDIHNANRIDRAGKGTFDRVMRGIALLQDNAIPYSIIAVITKAALMYPDELWNFFLDLHPDHLGFNVEEIEGIHEQSSLHTDEDIHQYQRFFKRILELRDTSSSAMSIREVSFLTDHLKHYSLDIHSQTNTAMSILNFDCDGNISTFSPELLTMKHPSYKNFIFGNVFEGVLEDVLGNQNFISVNADIQQGVSNCQQTCDYFQLCGGGCPSNKVSENGTFASTETTSCRLKVKAATDALIEHLEKRYSIIPYQTVHKTSPMTRKRLLQLHQAMVSAPTLHLNDALSNNSPNKQQNLQVPVDVCAKEPHKQEDRWNERADFTMWSQWSDWDNWNKWNKNPQ